ncbi:glycosyltransferase [Candidatus Dojkabacteria bacterium]|nr:glycosyltransferase [Candidatus Dojkabacteria bacterium]
MEKVSIIIPVYNESNRIESSLKSIFSYIEINNDFEFEVIVVDDGSVDNTEEIVRQFSKVNFYRYEENKGKGRALKYGVNRAAGDYIYICDADLSTPISELDKYLQYITEYDCVIGSRAVKGAKENSALWRIVLGKFGNFLIKFVLGLSINDTQCGFKLFNNKASKVFSELSVDRWGYDFELLYLLHQRGFKIMELPVKWVAAKGSKISLKDYYVTFKELFWVWKKYIGFSRKFFETIWKNYGSFFRYLIVGVVTNLLDIMIFVVWVQFVEEKSSFFGNPRIKLYHIIETVAYISSVTANYTLHKLWSFKANTWNIGELLRYVILLIVNYCFRIIFITLFVDYFSLASEIAKILSLVFILTWNYFILKKFVYKV